MERPPLGRAAFLVGLTGDVSPYFNDGSVDSGVGVRFERGVDGIFRREEHLAVFYPATPEDHLAPFVGKQDDASVFRVSSRGEDNEVSSPDSRSHEVSVGDDGKASFHDIWQAYIVGNVFRFNRIGKAGGYSVE